jgi:hypothetical protein
MVKDDHDSHRCRTVISDFASWPLISGASSVMSSGQVRGVYVWALWIWSQGFCEAGMLDLTRDESG